MSKVEEVALVLFNQVEVVDSLAGMQPCSFVGADCWAIVEIAMV